MTHVVVVTAAPDLGLPDQALAEIAEAVRSAPHRLGACGAEIACAGAPDLPALRAAHPQFDVNALPARGRRKRLLLADMDSTVIPVECIDEIADFAGVKSQVAAITERAMLGELDFEAALRERVGLLEGLPEAALADVFAERIRLNPGARTLVRTMSAHGAHTALVSGGFSYFTERVASAAGFTEHRANRLLFVNGALSGAVAEPILGRAAKLGALKEISARMGIDPSDAIVVGDGANDLSMVEAAGLGVAFRAKPALVAGADAVIRHADLTALLYLQGYSEGDFATD